MEIDSHRNKLPPPVVASKPAKKFLLHTSSTNSIETPTAPAHKPAPAVKPKQKTSPPSVHKKPTIQWKGSASEKKSSHDQAERPLKLESNSPGVSPILTKKQLQAVLSTELKRTISQEKIQEHKYDGVAAKKSPVAIPKVITRKPSPIKHKSSHAVGKKLTGDITSPSVLPVKILQQNETSASEDVYETPIQININDSSIDKTIENGTTENEKPTFIINDSTNDDTYATPIITTTSLGADEVYEVPVSTISNINNDVGEVYEVPIVTVDSSDPYETPDITSIRMIQKQLNEAKTDKPIKPTTIPKVPPHSSPKVPPHSVHKVPPQESKAPPQVTKILSQVPKVSPHVPNVPPQVPSHSPAHNGVKNTLTNGLAAHSNNDDIPPPPSMSPPKPKQSSISKRKGMKLPPVPSASPSGGNDGYTKVKGVVFNSRKVSKDGLIYEEINNPPAPDMDQDEYIDLSHLLPVPEIPGDPEAPPLPPRKPLIPGGNDTKPIRPTTSPLSIVKTYSPLGNDGLELTEDDEEYVDMSAVTAVVTQNDHSQRKKPNNRIGKNRAFSDTRLVQQISQTTPDPSLRSDLSQPILLEYPESDGIYEQMDISRPIPPPRKKNRHIPKPNKLTSSLSLDSSVTSNDNYITMHVKR